MFTSIRIKLDQMKYNSDNKLYVEMISLLHYPICFKFVIAITWFIKHRVSRIIAIALIASIYPYATFTFHIVHFLAIMIFEYITVYGKAQKKIRLKILGSVSASFFVTFFSPLYGNIPSSFLHMSVVFTEDIIAISIWAVSYSHKEEYSVVFLISMCVAVVTFRVLGTVAGVVWGRFWRSFLVREDDKLAKAGGEGATEHEVLEMFSVEELNVNESGQE